MKIKNYLLFTIISFFLVVGVAFAAIDYAAEQAHFPSTVKINPNQNGTSTIADDTITITGITGIADADIGNYAAVIKTTKDGAPPESMEQTEAPNSNNFNNGAVLQKSGSNITIDAAYWRNMALENHFLYITFYRINGDQKIRISGGYEAATPAPRHRLSEPELKIDRNKTTKLDDDFLTLNGIEIGSSTDYSVFVSDQEYKLASSLAGFKLTDLDPNVLIPIVKTSNGYKAELGTKYKTAVEGLGYRKLFASFVYKSGDDYYLVRSSSSIPTWNSIDMFTNIKSSFKGNTKTSQLNTVPLLTDIDVLGQEFKVVFSKEAISNDAIEKNAVVKSWAVTQHNCEAPVVLKSTTGGYSIEDNECYLEMAEKKGDTYITVVRVIQTEQKPAIEINGEGEISTSDPGNTNGSGTYVTLSKSVKINRPANLAYGSRFTVNLDPTSVIIYFNNLSTTIQDGTNKTHRKATYKIGLIDDKTILRNVRDGKSNAYSALITYAKKAKAIDSGDVGVFGSKASAEAAQTAGTDEESIEQTLISDASKYTAGKYYFLYLSLSDSDGYYAIDDIYIYNPTKKNGTLVFRTASEAKWPDIGEAKKEKEKNPKTGIINYSLIALAISIIALAVYLKTKKVTKFPQS